MKYSKATKIKLGIFLFALLIATSTVYYSNSLVSQLRQDNREVVSIYASIIAKTINEETDANLGFVFDEIIKKVEEKYSKMNYIIPMPELRIIQNK